MEKFHGLFVPLFHSRVCHYSAKTVAVRVVLETTVLATLTFAAMTGIAQAAPTPTETPVIAPQPTASQTPAETTPPPPSSISVQAVVKPPASQPTVPQCTRGSMPSPAPLALNTQQSGIIRVVDSPSYYKVYGNTTDQAKRQIAACSPIENGRYAAVTTSNINWQFTYSRDSQTGLCKLSTTAVGVHTAFLYPSWNTANPAWATFMKNISVHEQGHADRDMAAANAILGDLQGIPLGDCNTISATANTLANVRMNALRQANAVYDRDTSHGAAQGATL